MTWIYWKPERKQARWGLIPDDAQARQKAINQGAMFFTWMAFSVPVNGNGGPEAFRFGDFPLDFDAPNIADALKDLRALCFYHLPKLYEADPHEMQFYLSGAKGFHCILPAKWFNSQNGDPRLPLVYKAIASQWKSQFNLSTLDLSLFCMRRGKMLRIPNVRRENGNYKVPLTVDEIQRHSPAALVALGKEPRFLGDD
jgi:hypothetical protein